MHQKKILITGANSYIGTSFENWLQQYPNSYSADILDMIGGSWKQTSFSNYDVVFHVAGIAHIKETKENTGLYYKVNRDLVHEVARKAKGDGVKQFIFLSSMSVYGIDSGVIDENSSLNPKNNYGNSKLQAEELITALRDNNFSIAVLRPPMIYGKKCKGNYQRLANLALKLPLFPNVRNERSMIYIDNLCEFVRLLIDDCASGLFFPQNKEYVCTAEMVKLIAEVHGKRIRLTWIFNQLLRLLIPRVRLINKIFGNLVYAKNTNHNNFDYNLINFRESIRSTEA